MSSVDELRQLLKEDSNGQNLYDHLTQTLMKILIEKPKNAYENFELLSSDVKKNPLNPEPIRVNLLPPSPEQLNNQLNWTTQNTAMFKAPDEPPEDNGVRIPELLEDAALYEWAGINFGRTETYRLFLSIKKLCETLPSETERIRFFGRISTRSNPYYIVEGINPEDIEELDETKQEGKNGANKYAYWVTTSLETPNSWVKLPNVTMEQVVQVRLIKKLFTGNLDAEVNSYPIFSGSEKSLLRATIACIVGETSISPDGYFDVDNDAEPPVVVAADAEALNERLPKSIDDLKEVESWKHHEIRLNEIGRVLPLPEVLDENGDPIAPEKEIEITPPLEELQADKWRIKVAPGGAGLPLPGVAAGSAGGAVVVARSLLWPGAVAIAAPRKWVNVYVGNGLPANLKGERYKVPMPPAILSEWRNVEEEEVNEADFEGALLLEQKDVLVDPTPPQEEAEEED